MNRHVLLILKTVVILVCFLSYFCMMKVLYCGCWACDVAIAIGIVTLAICLYDRYLELQKIRRRKQKA